VLLGETFAVFFNIAYAIRQTFWDAGKGFAPRTADMTGAMAIAFAVVATIVVWVIAARTERSDHEQERLFQPSASARRCPAPGAWAPRTTASATSSPSASRAWRSSR
jgi:hypothetical protein